MQSQYKIIVSGVAPFQYPTETFFCILNCEKEATLEVPKMYPFRGEWGQPTDISLPIRDTFPMPTKLDMVWLSICEKCFYSVEHVLSNQRLESIWNDQIAKCPQNTFEYIIVGMAPFGKVALWFYSIKKSTLIEWIKGEVVDVEMSDFLPENPSMTLTTYCGSYSNMMSPQLPPRDLYDNYMKQFTYRYQILFERWDENKEKWTKYDEEEINMMPEFDFIDEALFDGTHDKLHDGGLMNYHEAGKPKKLAVQWHLKKSEWTAYFWFEDQAIRDIFDRFYGAHRDTKTDFILRFDPNKDKYELALYRYGLREPQVIPESAYQLIVFKNEFECFRSNSYNQERGAWIW